MQHEDFSIGMEFLCGGKRWRCTDLGRRTVVAIALEHDDDPSWYNGPPYAVAEMVFDEYDLGGCGPLEPHGRDVETGRDGQRADVDEQPHSGRRRRLPPVSWVTGGLRPGIDLTRLSDIQEMEDLEYVEQMRKDFK